jgi:predicted phage tail component-like protein
MALVSFFYRDRTSTIYPWLVVNKVHGSILPTQEHKFTQVPGRVSQIHTGKSTGLRQEQIDITIFADSQEELAARKRILAAWLVVDQPESFYYSYEPDKIYQAVLDESTDLDKIVTDGETTLVFSAPDPYAYGIEKEVAFNPDDINPVVTVTNDGSQPTFPRFEGIITADTTEFSIISGEDILYLGQPLENDSQTPVAGSTTILNDDMASLTGWTAGAVVDGGTIQGAFGSDGFRFTQASGNYGSGATWHGAAAIKTLSQSVQDFTVDLDIRFDQIAVNQMGRIELYLLDISNVHIGKIAIKDMFSTLESPQLEARAGALAGGKLFVAQRGPREGYWKGFIGVIRISRKGNKWTFFAGIRNASNQFIRTFTYSYVDVNNSYTQLLRGIQLHIAQYSNKPVPPVSNFYITNLRVVQNNTPAPAEVPYLFRTGDSFVIDCSSGDIFRNGEKILWALNPSGDYIKLQPGENNLTCQPYILSSGKIFFRERWL